MSRCRRSDSFAPTRDRSEKAGRPKVVEIYTDAEGRRVTRYSPGPYRTNAQLLTDAVVSSKHGMVSIKLERAIYNDGWSQAGGGWVRAKVEDEEQREHDPRAGSLPGEAVLHRGEVEQAAYTGKGREKRWSVACHNGCVDLPHGLGERLSAFDDGKVEVDRSQTGKFRAYSPPFLKAEPFRRLAVPRLDIAPSGERTSNVKPIQTKLGLLAQTAAQEAWLIQAARGPSWCRSAGDFRIAPGLPDIPASATWTLLTKATDGKLLWYREQNLILNLTGRVRRWGGYIH